METRRLLAVLLPVAVGSLIGCGGNEHEARLTKVEFQDAIYNLRKTESGGDWLDLVIKRPQEECATKARAFHEELERFLAKVEELRPPADVEGALARALTAGRESADTIGEVVDQIEAGELSCGEEVNERIYDLPSTRRAETALRELQRHGYDVFSERIVPRRGSLAGVLSALSAQLSITGLSVRKRVRLAEPRNRAHLSPARLAVSETSRVRLGLPPA